MILITSRGCKSKGQDPEQNKSKERGHNVFGSSGLSWLFKEARTNGWRLARHIEQVVHSNFEENIKRYLTSSLKWAYFLAWVSYAIAWARFFIQYFFKQFQVLSSQIDKGLQPFFTLHCRQIFVNLNLTPRSRIVCNKTFFCKKKFQISNRVVHFQALVLFINERIDLD